MKRCSKCGIEKDEGEFYKNKKTKDGLHCSCKECDKTYKQARRNRSGNTNSHYSTRQKNNPFDKHTDEYHLWESTYLTWYSMKQRCYNPHCVNYKHYGGRGIGVCKEWLEFDTFYNDMGLKPNLNMSIERVDVNGNYEPNNCVWMPKNQQQYNKRTSNRITAWGETKCLAEWIRDSRCRAKHTETIKKRISTGMSPEAAISKVGKTKYSYHKRHFLRKTHIKKYLESLRNVPDMDWKTYWEEERMVRRRNNAMPKNTPFLE